jgi:hypothetical protein
VHPLRSEVELEHLDRHQTTAVGIGCTKDRAQRSRADLMKDAERPNASGGAVPGASVCSGTTPVEGAPIVARPFGGVNEYSYLLGAPPDVVLTSLATV